MDTPHFSDLDKIYMSRAIELAKQGRFTTSPNPNVGCVIVANNTVVGEGYHEKAGLAHAEVNALAMAQMQAINATCYVTLEPCSHFGRTPPCALALTKAGVKRVVVAMVDPNPKVAGRGIKILQDAGIQVDIGLLEEQANDLNRGFIKRMKIKQDVLILGGGKIDIGKKKRLVLNSTLLEGKSLQGWI